MLCQVQEKHGKQSSSGIDEDGAQLVVALEMVVNDPRQQLMYDMTSVTPTVVSATNAFILINH